MKNTDFVIPYIEPAHGSEELKYALRSIEKNFDGQANIWLFGDKPEWVSDEVNHIPCERVNGIDYMVFMDTTSKIYGACNNKQIGYNFVYMYDDTFLINKTSYEDIAEIKCLENMKELPEANWFKTTNASSKWKNLMLKTLGVLQREGYRIYNFETHCPRVINKRKARQVIEKYNTLVDPLMFSTLYYNILLAENNETPRSLIPWGDGIKLGVYKEFDLLTLKNKLRENKFLNYNNASYNKDMKELLAWLFPDKCRFEK